MARRAEVEEDVRRYGDRTKEEEDRRREEIKRESEIKAQRKEKMRKEKERDVSIVCLLCFLDAHRLCATAGGRGDAGTSPTSNTRFAYRMGAEVDVALVHHATGRDSARKSSKCSSQVAAFLEQSMGCREGRAVTQALASS